MRSIPTGIARRFRLICALWNWRNRAGQLKDMATRTLLLMLQVRGLIELPPAPGPHGQALRTSPTGFEPELLPFAPHQSRAA